MKHIDIVFDSMPDATRSSRFIEVEDDQGKSICFGTWVHRPDGTCVLRFNDADVTPLRSQLHEIAPPKHVKEFDGELRCTNCDSTVDENGKWIDDDDHYGEDPDWCPYCDAKMRRG